MGSHMGKASSCYRLSAAGYYRNAYGRRAPGPQG